MQGEGDVHVQCTCTGHVQWLSPVERATGKERQSEDAGLI